MRVKLWIADVNQVVRDYLEQIAAKGDAEADAAELARLSRASGVSMPRWQFNREELHERR